MSIQSVSSAPAGLPGNLTARTDVERLPVTDLSPSVAGTAPAAGSTPPLPEPSASDIRDALDEVRQTLAPVAQDLLFSIDDDTGKTVIKVIDSSTDEVIRQIPSEEILAISKALDKLQGLLIKQEA